MPTLSSAPRSLMSRPRFRKSERSKTLISSCSATRSGPKFQQAYTTALQKAQAAAAMQMQANADMQQQQQLVAAQQAEHAQTVAAHLDPQWEDRHPERADPAIKRQHAELLLAMLNALKVPTRISSTGTGPVQSRSERPEHSAGSLKMA